MAGARMVSWRFVLCKPRSTKKPQFSPRWAAIWRALVSGDEAAAVDDDRVERDVFKNHPRDCADDALDVAAGREHLGERLGATVDPPVGQDSADLVPERDDVACLHPS